MNITTTKGISISLHTFEEAENVFKIIPYDKYGHKLGFLSFKLLNKNEVWLYQIATYEDFRNLGIGSLMLDTMEYITAVQHNCSIIKGKFSPTSFYAEKFYVKNGYEIVDCQLCSMIKKTLNKQQVKTSFEEKTKEVPKIVSSKREWIKTVVENEQATTLSKKQEFNF